MNQQISEDGLLSSVEPQKQPDISDLEDDSGCSDTHII